MLTDEEARAIQAVAKTTEATVDAGRKLGGFISKYIGGSLEQAIGIWEDKLKYRRWENQIRLAEKASDFLKARGLDAPSRIVNISIAIPLLEEAAIADASDELQDKWAMLLANAADANGPSIRRAYVGILAELTPSDAAILEMLYEADHIAPRNPDHSPVELSTADLPNNVSAVVPRQNTIDLGQHQKAVENGHVVDPVVELSLVNLGRLGLICSAAAFGGMANMNWVSMTELGRQFVIACRAPENSGIAEEA